MWPIVHVVHILAFLGCLIASGFKLRILSAPNLDAGALQGLRRLDKVSSSSTGAIILTGGAMLAGQAGRILHLSDPFFLTKIALFLLASSLVLASKVFLRRHPPMEDFGSVETPGWMRVAIAVDLGSILAIAGLGAAIAHGLL
ncbi:MAG: DUF2214 family protein [Phenylobacterium sp.]